MSIKTKTARAKLTQAMHWEMVSPGIGLGYRHVASGAGRWYVRNTRGGRQWMKRIGIADDAEPANGTTVLSYEQAQDRARQFIRSGGTLIDDGKPASLCAALTAYQHDLERRGCDPYNAQRPRAHLPPALLATPVSMLTAETFRRWRDGLQVKPATIRRTTKCIRAACELARRRDARITSNAAWQLGLESVAGGGNVARNVILDDDTVRRLVAAAYERDHEFGLLIETAAVTGARTDQMARIEIIDLQADRRDPRILMPRSGKGGSTERAAKKAKRVPVPITPSLAAVLRAAAKDRKATEPLLLCQGRTWKHQQYRHHWRAVTAAVGLDPDEVTLYALRHSAIVRELMANVPIRIVAATHDTSVGQIESNYSRFIADHSDALSRAALLNMQPNVVAMDKGSLTRA